MIIPPHHEVTGALGMALIVAREKKLSPGLSTFIGFDISNRIVSKRIASCTDCSNVCNLVNVTYDDGVRSVYGGICGKFEKNRAKPAVKLHNYFDERKALLLSYSSNPKEAKGRIGIPRILLFHELFPLWATFFQALGYEIVLSRELSKSVYEKGISKIIVDTCFPIRTIYGVIVDLNEMNVDMIFVPYVLNMKDDHYTTKNAHNCQYIQQLPDFIKASLDIQLLTHTVRMKDTDRSMESAFGELGRKLGAPEDSIPIAYRKAVEAQEQFYLATGRIGRRALDDVAAFAKAFVLIGHPYVMHDKFFNLNLVQRLLNSGIPVISADMLPVQYSADKSSLIDLSWKTNNRAINAIEFIHSHNKKNSTTRLLPVLITQFGCAADSMLTPYVKELLGENPWLEIEVDEHNSITGIMTRCEAFWESVPSGVRPAPAFAEVEKLAGETITLNRIRDENRTLYVLPICDAMFVMPEVLGRYNINCEMIDKTSHKSSELGRKYSNEKHCRTYQVILGDFLATSRKQGFDASKAAFFMFDYDEACRLSLFRSSYSMELRNQAGFEIPMFGTTVDDPLGWISTFGLRMSSEIWIALIAADYLSRYRYELRPYEKHKGEVERAYEQAKEELYKGIRQGAILKGYKSALRMMESVPVVNKDLVYVAVIGDAFTRVHEYGMAEIFQAVEEMDGVVILPPSWHDFINYGSEQRVRHLWRKRKLLRSLVTGIGSQALDQMRKRVQSISTRHSIMFADPSNKELSRYSREYVNIEVAPVIPSMFVGKTVDFIVNKKVHGLINAYGFNCCLGKVTTACINKLRLENDNIPMLTFIDDGLQQTNIRTRVESFMEQAWAFKRKWSNSEQHEDQREGIV